MPPQGLPQGPPPGQYGPPPGAPGRPGHGGHGGPAAPYGGAPDDRPWRTPGDDQRTSVASEPSDEPTSHRPAGAAAASGSPLSAIKVSGQAFAAVLTAAAGSFMGGASGTVAGAGIAAVITTVGDAAYQRSVERTRDHVRSRMKARRGPGRPGEVGDGAEERRTVAVGAPGRGAGPDEQPTVVIGGGARVGAAPATMAMGGGPGGRAGGGPGGPDDDRTRAIGDDPTQAVDPGTRAIGDDATQAVGPGTRVMGGPDDDPTVLHGVPGGPDDPYDDDGDPPRPTPWKRYGVLAATALLIFLIAMLAITGIERVKGSPISGGESGTSFGQVFGTAEPTTSTSAPETTTTSGDAPEATTTSGEETPTSTTGSTSQSRTTTSERPQLVPSSLLPGN
jgi:hypothetical protein